jgi:hypothetical protein
MSQLQPVPDLTNPLYIRYGNPDLKQEYTHNIQANLNLLSPYKNKNLFLFFTLQATRNKIVNHDSVNALTGKSYSIPVNVNGVYNFNSNISYGMPVRFLKGTIEVGGRSGYVRTRQFINSRENNIKTWALGPEISLDMDPNDKMSISVGVNFDYNNTKYSLESALNTNYLSQEYNTSFDFELPKLIFLSTEFTYTINSRRAQGFNTKVPIWNASVSKQFLKYNRGELKLSATDILKRNIGINRTTNQNYIEDSRVNTLRRFFMLTFTYSLSKTGLNNSGGGMMKIIRK